MTALRALSASFFLSIPFIAEASWTTVVRDDLFSDGKSAMLYGEVDRSHSLVFDCDSEELKMSLLEVGTWHEGMTGTVGKFVVKVDDLEKRVYDVSFYKRNEQQVAVGTSDEAIKNTLREIKAAKSKVLVGLAIPAIDSRWNSSADAIGSTTSVEKFTKACNIQL
ncbi:hypothetical protein [Pseudomonas oryzihabitans]|uniref:hypothetical protein n=1 Tax=Pseudomonas oryzihabitans TaxID=47885 RepID=UPI00128F948E|nr:hypothetical protein [Pseudomonas psychrotolerans]